MEKHSSPPQYSTLQPELNLPQSGLNPPPQDFAMLQMNSANPPVQLPQQTVNVTYNVPLAFGPMPVTTTCPSCHAQVSTRIEAECTTKTHCMSLLLCCIGGLLCFWIPYCMDSCQNLNHYCPNCDAYLGQYTN